MAELSSSKEMLRQTFLERRMQIPAAVRHSATERAFDIFFRHVTLPQDAVVAGYWPIHAELDDMPILHELCRRNHRCSLPHVADPAQPLLFRAWDETSPMIMGRYNIAEPDTDVVVQPDVILVPMAAFDTTGHRLGYGGGFYDRTLKMLKPVLAIGIAYEEQRHEHLPAEENDVRLDMIVTDRNFYNCGDIKT